MITKLEGPLRREIDIGGEPHVITISPAGFMLTLKGRRKGLEIAWVDLVSGEAALATALNASLSANLGAKAKEPVVAQAPAGRAPKTKSAKAKRAPRLRRGSA